MLVIELTSIEIINLLFLGSYKLLEYYNKHLAIHSFNHSREGKISPKKKKNAKLKSKDTTIFIIIC